MPHIHVHLHRGGQTSDHPTFGSASSGSIEERLDRLRQRRTGGEQQVEDTTEGSRKAWARRRGGGSASSGQQPKAAEARAAIARLTATLRQGDNRFGEYGRNVREAIARWEEVLKRETSAASPMSPSLASKADQFGKLQASLRRR